MFLLNEHCFLGYKDLLALEMIEIILISFFGVSHELAPLCPRFQLIEVVSFNIGRAAPNLNNLKIELLPFPYLYGVDTTNLVGTLFRM